MSVWSARRQVLYTLVILLVIFGVVGLFLIANQKKPTCFDGKKNQNELDVDCGGACTKVCQLETSELVKRWARVFRVRDGLYDVAARIDNPNIFGIGELAYHFKLYDAENTLVREARGTTFVNPDQSFIVLSTGVETGFQVPVKAFVEITGQSEWVRYGEYKRPTFVVKDKTLTLEPKPRLAVRIGNDSLFDVENVEVTAIVLDQEGTAIGVSKSSISTLDAGKTEDIFFTWPEQFTGEPKIVEVYPRINTTKGVK